MESLQNRDDWPTDEWRTALPESVGLDPLRVSAAAQAARVRLRTVNALLVVKNGYLVLEQYDHGFDAEASHHVMSVTKSVISALIGIAVQQGYLKNVQQPVLDFFPEYQPGPYDGAKRNLTLHHLLTMTSGIAWRTSHNAAEPMLDRLWRSPDWKEFILSLPVNGKNLGKFQYNSAGSHLLSILLTRATGRSAREFANEQLFAPLGMTPIPTDRLHDTRQSDLFELHTPHWLIDPQGHNTGGWGLALKPRDMARLGWLYLNQGRWNGQSIFPAQWVADSTRAATPGYGYQWWIREGVYGAAGRGGHHIFCIPDQDMVVVIVSQQAGKWQDRWPFLEEYFL